MVTLLQMRVSLLPLPGWCTLTRWWTCGPVSATSASAPVRSNFNWISIFYAIYWLGYTWILKYSLWNGAANIMMLSIEHMTSNTISCCIRVLKETLKPISEFLKTFTVIRLPSYICYKVVFSRIWIIEPKKPIKPRIGRKIPSRIHLTIIIWSFVSIVILQLTVNEWQLRLEILSFINIFSESKYACTNTWNFSKI